MSSIGKLEVEVAVKSGADKYWSSIADSTVVFPQAVPDIYKSIEVLEGDGKSVGSVRLIQFSEGSPIVSSSKEKFEVVDEANKTVEYSVIGGEILKYYKTFKAKLVVTPKAEGSSVKWTCEFEKASDEVPDPSIIRDTAVKTLEKLDAFITNA